MVFNTEVQRLNEQSTCFVFFGVSVFLGNCGKNAISYCSNFNCCHLSKSLGFFFCFFFFRLKDWKTRLSYFLQHSSSPEKPKTSKKNKQQAFVR